MKTITPVIVSLGTMLCLLTGCATPPVVLHTVGPAQAGAAIPGAQGYLRVYSATRTREIGEDTFYYTHTRYHIFDPAGTLVKTVPNHLGDMDQNPADVNLPAGRYLVKAQSDVYGWVTVPVVIIGGQTTEVHLESTWRGPDVAAERLVRLPDGRPVGWRYDVR